MKITIYEVLVMILLLAVLGLGLFINHYKEEIILNPFIFGANKLGGVECSCIQLRSVNPILFRFNETGIYYVYEKINRANPSNLIPFNDLNNIKVEE